MVEIKIDSTNENQRLDKYIIKFLNTAPKSFVYKMIRKKNIKINGKKTEESYILKIGDILNIFLSDDTINKFQEAKVIEKQASIDVVYEDENILILNKPVGLLSHSANKKDEDTMISRALYYLVEKGEYNPKDTTFTPALANRLDRNTSGLVILGKNLRSLQELNRIIKENEIDKFYKTIVKGKFCKSEKFSGYHLKNEETNTVQIFSEDTGNPNLSKIETAFKPIVYNNNFSLLEVQLITGKSHQIREHLNVLNHPIVGDRKYGDKKTNEYLNKIKVQNQLLHSYKIQFNTNGFLAYLNNKNIHCPTPMLFNKTLEFLELNKGGN